MCPIDAARVYPLEPHLLRCSGRHSFSFVFLRRGSFVLKCPFHCIAGLLEFDQSRKLCWFLLGTYHCRNQLASQLTENLAKSPQVLEVVNCHLQLLPQTVTGLTTSRESWYRAPRDVGCWRGSECAF